MSSHTVSKLATLAIVVAFTGGQTAEPDDVRMQLVREGRFVYFAELDSITRDGANARMRSVQLSAEPSAIGGKNYIGGYSWWQFDCIAKTGQRMDYASLRDDLVIGPVMPIDGPVIELSPGGEAAELAAVACGWVEPRVDATHLSKAIQLTRDAD